VDECKPLPASFGSVVRCPPYAPFRSLCHLLNRSVSMGPNDSADSCTIDHFSGSVETYCFNVPGQVGTLGQGRSTLVYFPA